MSWTFETLKEHFDDLRKADQEAVKVLADNFEKRMANTNEWRGAVDDQQKKLADKESTDRRLKTLEDVQLAAASRSIGAGQLYAAAVAIVVAVGAVIGLILKFAPGVH